MLSSRLTGAVLVGSSLGMSLIVFLGDTPNMFSAGYLAATGLLHVVSTWMEAFANQRALSKVTKGKKAKLRSV